MSDRDPTLRFFPAIAMIVLAVDRDAVFSLWPDAAALLLDEELEPVLRDLGLQDCTPQIMAGLLQRVEGSFRAGVDRVQHQLREQWQYN